MNKDFKVGQRIWIKDMKEFGTIVEIKGDGYHSDLESGIDFSHFDNIHQTADDMFEELGFKKSVNDGIKLAYSNGLFAVVIDIKDKTYTFSDRTNTAFYLDLDLHLAIHQKLIELGYIE